MLKIATKGRYTRLVLGAFVFMFVGSKSSFAQFERVFNDCMQRYDDIAIESCSAVLQLPQLMNVYEKLQVHIRRSSLLYWRGDLDGARHDVNQAIDMYPQSAEAWCLNGIIHARQKDYANAIMNYNHALLLKPQFPECLYFRSLARVNQSDFKNALFDLNTSIEFQTAGQQFMDWFEYRSLIEKAKVLANNFNRFVEGLEILDDLVAKNLNIPDIYLVRGDFLYFALYRDDAIKDFSRAIQLDPGDARGYEGRSTVFESDGNYELALGDARQWLNIAPDNSKAIAAVNRLEELVSKHGDCKRLVFDPIELKLQRVSRKGVFDCQIIHIYPVDRGQKVGTPDARGLIYADWREVPSIVLLYRSYDAKSGWAQPSCTGTVIGRRHILTAAHCALTDRQEKLIDLNREYIGIATNTNNGFSPKPIYVTRVHFPDIIKADPSSIKHAISKELDDRTLNVIAHDVAVLEVNVDLEAEIQPLLSYNYLTHVDFYNSMYLTAFGYSPTVIRGIEVNRGALLRAIMEPMYSKLHLTEKIKAGQQYQEVRVLFASAQAKTCPGFSGGPLMIEHNSSFFQVALTSAGNSEGGGRNKTDCDGTYDIYSVVSHHEDWIRRIVPDVNFVQ